MRQIDALKSPRFTQISTFGRLPHSTELKNVRGVFIGIPFDSETSYRAGSRFGPLAIRNASRMLRPYNPYRDVYPFEILNASDFGDINIIPGSTEKSMVIIEEKIYEIANNGVFPFIAGGDHLITLPVLRALAKHHGKLNIIQFDAHFDFWDSYWGEKYTHGTWLKRALEEDLIKDVIQVGIRSYLYSKEDLEFAKKNNIRFFVIEEVKNNIKEVVKEINSIKGKSYITFDIDAIDIAYAPGTGAPEPGGLTSYEALYIMRNIEVELVGFDLTEVSPPYDVAEITSTLASYLIYEAMSLVAKKLQ